MNNNKLKVALICDFSNPKIQKYIKLRMNRIEKIIRTIKNKSCDVKALNSEHAIWITNSIVEFEKMSDEIELHIISPYGFMKTYCQEFDLNMVHYHFFQNEDCIFWKKIINKLLSVSNNSQYKTNRKYIKKFINKINPDIVYMTGAENPHYSLSALDIPKSIPLVVHLQTLMNDPSFEKNYPIEHNRYLYRANCELKVLKRADYIATTVEKFVNIIKHGIIPSVITLAATLAVGEDIEINSNIIKKYDFVYFSANINKAIDLAIEGFGIASKINPSITLLVVGDYDYDYKLVIDKRLAELGIEKNVTFTGRLPTHQDVLNTIQSAKYALLPLKIDITSGTIREAMACNLPVITTITENGTPKLNENRETVLLSDIGNHQALADNMLKLINNPKLVEQLIVNGKLLMQEKYSNNVAVKTQKQCLFAAYNNFKYGTQIPEEYQS